MSIRFMSWVWDTSPREGRELLVELALADFANDAGECWPSVETLARKARCSERHVQATIRGLEADGRLEVRTGEGPRGTNLYCLTAPGVQPIHPAITDKRGAASDRGGEVGDRGGAISVSLPAPDPSITVTDPSSDPSKLLSLDGWAEVRLDFESLFGLLPGHLLAEAKEYARTVPADWFLAALTETRERADRPNWKYCKTILDRSLAEGVKPGPRQKKTTAEPGSARAQFMERYAALQGGR